MNKPVLPPGGPGDGDRILDEPLSEALSKRYLAYALSTIGSRALPDVRDGLKPVHRRVLHAMNNMRLNPEGGARKCAKVVGEVMGNFHPHGDQSIYDALVRLAQDFSQRVPLVDGQGNFGNIDGDNPAAMRYTECKMTAAAMLLLDGIDEDAVDFKPSYDGQDEEPVVLPSGFPNLLANGSSGIAVGMATSIPPHNPAELIDACLLLLSKPEATTAEILERVPGPDFPTGGVIVESRESLLETYETGRGGVRTRAKWEKEDTFAHMGEEVLHELAAAAGHVRSADLGRGQGPPDPGDGVVMQLVELLRRALPVGGTVGLVPDLEIPGLDLGPAIAFDAVADPLVGQLRPLVVILGWIAPAAADQVVIEPRPPGVLVGFGMGRQGLGHEADLHIGPDPVGQIGVEQVVEDRPVIDRAALGVLGIDIGAAPLQGGGPVAGVEQVVGAEIDRLGRQGSQMAQQLAAVLHGRVVRLVGPEEPPDRPQLADRLAGVDGDLDWNGARRLGQRRRSREQQGGQQAESNTVAHDFVPPRRGVVLYAVGRDPACIARVATAIVGQKKPGSTQNPRQVGWVRISTASCENRVL